MRKILLTVFIFILIASFGCGEFHKQPISMIVDKDTIPITINNYDSAFIVAHRRYDSLKHENDSLRTALTRANFFKIRVNYYRTITNKNPKKFSPFLRGWINGLFENQ